MKLGPKSAAMLSFLRDKESLSLNEVHRKIKPMLTRLANAGYIEIRQPLPTYVVSGTQKVVFIKEISPPGQPATDNRMYRPIPAT